MMWPDEVRVPDFDVEVGDVKDTEVKMAHMLVETLAGDFDASEFEDDYAGAVEALVKTKIEGGEVKRTERSTKTSGEVVDLLAALQKSVAAAKTARGEAPDRRRLRRRRRHRRHREEARQEDRGEEDHGQEDREEGSRQEGCGEEGQQPRMQRDLIGLVAGFIIATITAPVGVPGPAARAAEHLAVPNPQVTPTNLLYNVISGPGALVRYLRRRQRTPG